MANSYVKTTNDVARGVTQDGLILDVNSGDLGNSDTSYTYFLLNASGYDAFSLEMTITATTLTFEASNDDLNLSNEADEQIYATNDRTFAGAGNWEASDDSASVAVNAGALDVTVGDAGTGAMLDRAYFGNEAKFATGFLVGKKYTVTFTIASLSAGTVSIYAGDQLIASGLTDGAGQTAIFTKTQIVGTSLKIVGSNAAATFSLDNISITTFPATWVDVTSEMTGGATSSFTATASYQSNASIPWQRFRIKRVTTNATNALELRLSRMRLGMGV